MRARERKGSTRGGGGEGRKYEYEGRRRVGKEIMLCSLMSRALERKEETVLGVQAD